MTTKTHYHMMHFGNGDERNTDNHLYPVYTLKLAWRSGWWVLQFSNIAIHEAGSTSFSFIVYICVCVHLASICSVRNAHAL